MTAEVEFIARFPKRKLKTQEEIDEENVNRIISSDYEPIIEYEYSEVVIDLFKVAEMSKLDAEHTHVVMNYGLRHHLKIQYERFKQIKQLQTRLLISHADDFQFESVKE